MSFFELPPARPEPPRQPTPEWFGPADNILSVGFPLDELLARTGRVAIRVHAGQAFPTGFEFTLMLNRREPRSGRLDNPIMHWHEVRPGELPEGALRFGVELADGRKATVFDRLRHRPGEDPDPQAALMQRGGGSDSHRWEIKFWAWPLPPPGPFTFVVEWPAEGIALTRVEIESAPIREAAAKAEELWPLETGA